MTGKQVYRTRIDEVPLEPGLSRDDGWIDMQVQFLIGSRRGGTDDLVVGRTVLPPGARHDRHLHHHADEFLVVLSGAGEIYTDEGREPSAAGDVVFTPRGHWHGFDNTGAEDVVLIWGWSGAGALDQTGYAVPEHGSAGPGSAGPAEHGGSPAEHGGSPGEHGGSPAEHGGGPGEHGGPA